MSLLARFPLSSIDASILVRLFLVK